MDKLQTMGTNLPIHYGGAWTLVGLMPVRLHKGHELPCPGSNTGGLLGGLKRAQDQDNSHEQQYARGVGKCQVTPPFNVRYPCYS